MATSVDQPNDWEDFPTNSEKSETFWLQNFQHSKSANMTRCLLCTDAKTPFAGINKFVLKRHYCTNHSAHGKLNNVAVKRRGLQNDESSQAKKKKISGSLSKGDYIKDCVMLAVFHSISFILFNSSPFRELTLIHALHAGTVINAMNIGIYIATTAKFIRNLIIEEVQHRMFSIKLDIATRHHRSMLGVNIQFYSRIRKCIVIRNLGCIELTKSHTSKYLQVEVYKLLDRYGINRRNIYSFTSDNGANMIRLGRMLRSNQHDLMLDDELRKMQQQVQESDSENEDENDEDFQFDYQEKESDLLTAIKDPLDDGLMAILVVVRCAAHTLQLAVHDVLKSSCKEEIQNIRKIVKELKSTKYLNYMSDSLRTLKINVVTRWNSLYIMFESVLDKQIEFNDMYGKLPNDLKKNVYLGDDDFLFMRQFTEAFRPVFECTLRLQSEQLAMSKF